jgi:hypothetical protein
MKGAVGLLCHEYAAGTDPRIQYEFDRLGAASRAPGANWGDKEQE